MRFTGRLPYNSVSTLASEFGYGWTSLLNQQHPNPPREILSGASLRRARSAPAAGNDLP
jgi:hypothetical protein